MSFEKFTKKRLQIPAFQLAIGIAAFVGLKDYMALVIPEKIAVTLILSILSLALIVSKWKYRKVRETITKPQAAKLFTPFLQPGVESADKQWPRFSEVEILSALLSSSSAKHVSLVGETGVGKSTLITQLETRTDWAICLKFSSYSEISRALLDGVFDITSPALKSTLLSRRTRLVSSIVGAIKRTELTTHQAFDRGYADADLDAIAVEILDFMEICANESVAANKVLVLIFDQYERHMQLLRDIPGSNSQRSELVDWYLFRLIVDGLRLSSKYRTLFAVRSDWLLPTIVSTYPCDPMSVQESPDFSGYWALRICHGVNAYSSVEAYAAVRASLSLLKLAASDLEDFERATGLKSEQFSNTFLVQLSGYLIEHYWEVDNKRLRRLLNEETERIQSVKLLFDYIENDFIGEGHSDSRYELLKAVLFTVAIENRSTGTNASLGRIAALSHLSEDEIRPQLEYLCSWGVILQERLNSGELGFRVGHDLIGDYVIDHERLSAGSRFKDAIQSLSNLRAKNSFLTQVGSFPSLFGDIGKNTNTGQALILLYIFYGLLKVISPNTCNAFSILSLGNYGENLTAACMESLFSFPAVFIMNCVWLNYIYILARGYLSLSLKGRIIKCVANALPGLGAILAIAFSQTLQFALVPILIVGLLLGLVLAVGAKSGDFHGNVADENFHWGYRTIFNMLFASCLMIFAPIFINPSLDTVNFFDELMTIGTRLFGTEIDRSPEILSATSWMFFGAAIMTYFCWHISAEQQGRLSIAARLALHDRARADYENLP